MNHDLLSFDHAGTHYSNFTAAAALARGVPQAVVDAAEVAGALARLAARRWRAECAGTTWEEHRVATDRDAQTALTAATILAAQPGFATITWKFADGTFASLDADDIGALGAVVTAHVEGCFANEQALQAAVRADPDVADIDAGWPA